MKDKTACFTGHRDIPPLKRPGIKHRLEREIERSIQAGYVYFGAGGALGFDTLAAQMVLKLKERYPDIKLILVLPCKTQTSGWKQTDIDEYERIKAAADKVVFTSEVYYRGCMHKRNRHLVDNSSLCICYLTEDRGGTYYTVNYAKENGLKIIEQEDDGEPFEEKMSRLTSELSDMFAKSHELEDEIRRKLGAIGYEI